MPPKRRVSSPASAPEPKRRITRSSTKGNLAVEAGATASKIEPKSSKAKQNPQAKSKTAHPTTPSKSKPTKSKTPKADTSTTQDPTISGNSSTIANNVSHFTITADAVKNPIQCESYTTTSSSSSSSSPRTLIFTHGAGGTLSAPAVVNFCNGYATSLPICAFQGSMNLSSRVKGFHACIEHFEDASKEKGKERQKTWKQSTVLGGRSMGARAAVIAATELLAEDPGEQDTANPLGPIRLILISYPLKGPKDDIRDAILLSLPAEVHVLFVIGDRDAMCPLDLLSSVRAKMMAKSRLIVVKGADHGMHVRPAKRERGVGEETGRRAAEWVQGGMRGDGDGFVEVGEEEEEEEEGRGRPAWPQGDHDVRMERG